MKLLSLFSGIGAFEKALTNLGIDYELVGFSEIDKWAIESYSAIHDVSTDLNLGDVSEIEIEDIPETDIVTYGFPCQDVSVAGKQKGISCGTRSGLLFEAERIIDGKKPKYAIAENVKNLVGKRFKEDFNDLLERLDDYGYNNYWGILNAKDYGIPQNRERVFIVSIKKDIDDGTFKFPEPKELKLTLKDMLDDEVEDKYRVSSKSVEKLISIHKKLPEDEFLVGGMQKNQSIKTDGICTTLTGSMGLGGGYIPMAKVKVGTKKGYDIATVEDSINLSFPNSKTRRGRVGKGVAQTLDTQCNQAVLQTIKIDNSIKPSVAKNFEREKENISKSEKEIYQCKCESGWQDNKVGLKVSPTLRAGNSHTSVLDNNYVVRKLTPLECWRLMGFEDEDYWKARRRLEEVFYNGNDRSNSQMYKQAGNSIVVNVLEGIFKELFKLEEE